ncbi:hypothetical protein J6590_081121 [Homalodisca vitripennis]|nr:hypothetical protein J6590_081121 [Homalodisca vitripennis]
MRAVGVKYVCPPSAEKIVERVVERLMTGERDDAEVVERGGISEISAEAELYLKKKLVTIGKELVILQCGKNCTVLARLFSDVVIPARSQTVTNSEADEEIDEPQSKILEPKSNDRFDEGIYRFFVV